MKAVFADTFYFLALLNERDAAHKKAVAASRIPGLLVTTTEFVLLEVADALCQPHQREEVLALWNVVETDPAFRLIRVTTDLTERGRKFYRERPDKEWPLTDCISFVVMQEEGLSDALTAIIISNKPDSKPCWCNGQGDYKIAAIVTLWIPVSSPSPLRRVHHAQMPS